jgi:hypothetical protein
MDVRASEIQREIFTIGDRIRAIAQELWGLWLVHWDAMDDVDRNVLKPHIDLMFAFSEDSRLRALRIEGDMMGQLTDVRLAADELLDQVAGIETSFDGLKRALTVATDALQLCDAVSSGLLSPEAEISRARRSAEALRFVRPPIERRAS